MARTNSNRIEAIKLTAPAHWASYLVNGETGDLTENELAQADAFRSQVHCGSPVDAQEIGYACLSDASTMVEGVLACELCEYTFLRIPNVSKAA